MKKLCIVICCLVVFTCKGQVNVMLYPLQSLELKPSDVFKADIQNLGTSAASIYLVGSIINTSTGKQIVSAKSQVLSIAPGIKSISESDVSPHYTIQSSVVSQTGYLPYGNYEVCLRAMRTGSVEEVGNDCQETEISPLSPPLLLSPENQSTVTEQYPLLVWLPPMPVGKDKVVYDLKLVELMPNQTPYDAIQRNFAILEKQNISGTTLQYPANVMQLTEGKKYAWKIAAKTADRKPIGETEIWWFTKGKILETYHYELPITKNFVRLKNQLDPNYIIVQNELKVIYEEKYAVSTATFIIKDIKGKKVEDMNMEIKEVGDNKIVIDLTSKKLKDNQFYILETTADGRPKQFLMFKNIKQ